MTTDTRAYPVDRSGMLVLPVQECLDRLAAAPIGRIAFVQNGEPVILPVNHGVHGTSVVFRSPVGSKLFAADRGQAVSFEADFADVQAKAGWSVVVRGVAEIVDDPVEIAQLDKLGIQAWAIKSPTDWVRIRSYEVSGRQVVPS